MSIVLRLHEPDDYDTTVAFIHFDAITDYSRSDKAKVTKHPVDRDSPINDHYTPENSEYKISGIISSADINMDSMLIRGVTTSLSSDGEMMESAPLNITNLNQQPLPVSISGGNSSWLSNIIPDSIGQFLTVGTPDVIIDEGSARTDWTDVIRRQLKDAMRGIYKNSASGRIESRPLLAEIHRFNRQGQPEEVVQGNLVITSLDEKETPENNGAMFLDITLEEVRFVRIKEEEIPKSVTDKMSKAARPETDKGDVSGGFRFYENTPETEEAKKAKKALERTQARDFLGKALESVFGD